MDRSHRKCPGSATVALLALGALLATSCGRPATDNRAAAGNGKPPADASTNDHASADTAPADETSDVAQPSDDAQTEVALAGQDPAPRTPEESSDQKPFAPPEPDATKAAADEPPSPFPRQIPLPPDTLDGGLAWINTGGPLELKALRGKFVLLDFWTYCCINCMHILPELKKLEAQFPNELVVIGVHSAKFETEEDSKNITDAVLRYEIEHPVVNDAKHTIWNRFGVESWPTAILIDPEGNAVYGQRGEFKAESFAALLNRALPYYRKKGTLDATPLRFDLAAYRADKTPLRFPGKVLADEAGDRLFIADSNHNRIIVAKLDGTLLDTIGSGAIGAADGGYAEAKFDHPQGMALKDDTLYVADTENHLLRKIDLKNKQVSTIAGVGHQGHNAWPGLDPEKFNAGDPLPERYVGKPRTTEINSPWALWIHGPDLYIAMAGPHQIWKMPLDESEIGPYAGNGREDIVNGPLLPKEPYEGGFASFAQPSGLASDGKSLFVADSEGSSIRAVPFDPKGEVTTVVGTSKLPYARLFTFGDVDGEGDAVRLQHCLGVAYVDGQLYVADTYNNKVKAIDTAKGAVRTIAGTGKPGRDDEPATFDEPAGLSAAAGKLYVADTNNHLIRTIDLRDGNKVATLEIKGLEPPKLPEKEFAPANDEGKAVEVPPLAVKPIDNAAHLTLKLQLPMGWKINPIAPMRYRLEAEGEQGVVDAAALGEWQKVEPPSTDVGVKLPLAKTAGEQTLKLTLDYYYCQEGAEGVCKAGRVSWTLPLKAAADGQEAGTIEYKVE